MLVAQPYLTLCDPVDSSPPGFSVNKILQARILKWVAIPFSRRYSRPRDQIWISCIGDRSFTVWATREAQPDHRFSRSVMSDSSRRHGLQHTRPPYPSTTPRVYPNPCPSSQWCHPTISSSVVSFSSCPQSFPASGSFQMSQLFTSGELWQSLRML